MQSIRILLLAVCVGSSWSCAEDDDSSDSAGIVSADAIATSDFDEGDLTPVLAKDLADEIKSLKVHKNRGYSSQQTAAMFLTTAKSFVPGCEDVTITDDVITAKGPDISFHMNIDFSACLEAQFEKSGMFKSIDRSSAYVNGYYESSCPGADYSTFDGKTVSTLLLGAEDGVADPESATACLKGSAVFSSLSKLALSTDFAATLTDEAAAKAKVASLAVAIREIEATMGDDGLPCRFVGSEGTTTVENCSYKKRKTTDGSDGSHEVILTKAEITGMEGNASNRYLTEGELPLRVNEWSGAITLDGTASPGWTLSNGSEALSGELGSKTVSNVPKKTPKDEDEPDETAIDENPYKVHPVTVSPNARVVSLGVYESESGAIAVTLDHPNEPVVLVLSSYDSVNWDLNVASGTKLELVIKSGFKDSFLSGAPTGTDVVSKPLDKFPYFYAYEDDSAVPQTLTSDGNGGFKCVPYPGHVGEWTKAKNAVREITGLEISDAQGVYSASSFTVDGTTIGSTLTKASDGSFCIKQPDGTYKPIDFPEN